jgi:multidrug transporter EmrE-like cation transporter
MKIAYWGWLLISSVLFAGGEFLSKKFVMNPKVGTLLWCMLLYNLGTAPWFFALFHKNDLSTTGVIWTLTGVLTTVATGLFVFKEPATFMTITGILLAIASLVLLSWQ